VRWKLPTTITLVALAAFANQAVAYNDWYRGSQTGNAVGIFANISQNAPGTPLTRQNTMIMWNNAQKTSRCSGCRGNVALDPDAGNATGYEAVSMISISGGYQAKIAVCKYLAPTGSLTFVTCYRDRL
jgi:hypothetical protein